MGSFGLVRGVTFVVGLVMVVGGFAALGFGGLFLGTGLWLVVGGSVLMIVAVLERRRYRSEAAERSNDPIGPGGGETEAVEPRFRPTQEVFVDPRTGERRYVAEA